MPEILPDWWALADDGLGCDPDDEDTLQKMYGSARVRPVKVFLPYLPAGVIHPTWQKSGEERGGHFPADDSMLPVPALLKFPAFPPPRITR